MDRDRSCHAWPWGARPVEGDGVVVVIPTPATGAAGPVAVWIELACWAEAARDRWGHAWLVTPEGILSPEDAKALASSQQPLVQAQAGWRRRFPRWLGTAKKDLRDIVRARRFRHAAVRGPWDAKKLAFVVQHHELFQWAGFVAARASGRPLVLFVDAPLVWEAEKWGVRRPGWGTALEHVAERPQLRRADLVACVSEEVAEEVIKRGARQDRVIVTPCSVNTSVFAPDMSGEGVRERHGLRGRFVVGWVGSFRRFHGIDLLLRSFADLQRRHPDAALLLVGDGFERPAMEHSGD